MKKATDVSRYLGSAGSLMSCPPLSSGSVLAWRSRSAGRRRRAELPRPATPTSS